MASTIEMIIVDSVEAGDLNDAIDIPPINVDCNDDMDSTKSVASTFKEILEANVRDLQQVGNLYFTGYVEGEESYNEFVNQLLAIGVKFVVRSSCQRASASEGTNDLLAVGHRILFQSKTGISIPMMGSPFVLEKNSQMHCKFGDYYKKKSAESDKHSFPVRKRMRIRGSKKRGCPANMMVKQVRVFKGEKYKIPVNELNKKEHLSKAIAALRKDLETASDSVIMEQRFYIQISALEEHSHGFGLENDCALAIHPDIAKKIHELVDDGVTSVQTLQNLLRRHVDSMFTDAQVKPSESNHGYYPTKKAVKTQVYLATQSRKYRKLDQPKLRFKVYQWKEEEPDSQIYYRECQLVSKLRQKAGDSEKHSLPDRRRDDADCASDYEQTFLFVHQSEWQRQLLNKYGGFCLLDAAHKVTSYDLPFFFVYVKTNVGYSAVGEFIVQFETSDCVTEALRILQQWNLDWNPTFFLSDLADVEMNAVKDVFPSAKMYVGDFYRVQAWTRWARNLENVASWDFDTLLHLWRNIAHAATEDAFKAQVSHLTDSVLWNGNLCVRQYFSETWLPAAQLWVKCFRESDFDCYLNTNNGVEAQKVMKHSFLKNHTDKPVSGFFQLVAKKYLPEMYKSYVEQNVQISSVYAEYNDNMPPFLHNRPLHFIKHVITSIHEAQNFTENIQIIDCDSGAFQVMSSSNKDVWYDVEFITPSCSCGDYFKWRFPCKHLCAVFQFIPEWGFDKLPPNYGNNPHLCIDSSVVIADATASALVKLQFPACPTLKSPLDLHEVDPEALASDNSVKGAVERVIEKICLLKDLVRVCKDKEVLEELDSSLEQWISAVKASLPSEDGSGATLDALCTPIIWP